MKRSFVFAMLGFCLLLPLNSFAQECPSNWKALHIEWIWCDDFETNKLSSYFDPDSPALLNRIAAVGFNGSVGVQATWTAGQVNAGSLKLAFGLVPAASGITPPAGVDTTTKFREVYYRVYLKSQAGWNSGTSGNNSKMSRATSFVDANWSQAMIAHLWSNDTNNNNNYLRTDPASCVNGSIVQCVGYNDFGHIAWLGAVNGTTAIFAASNTSVWSCIEVHVKLNDAGQSNGVEEFWIDGNLEARSANLDFVGSYSAFGINVILFENYINNGSPQAQSRYWDNIVVSTQRIGCLSSAAITPPANLRVR
jgi:hypothetical protein